MSLGRTGVLGGSTCVRYPPAGPKTGVPTLCSSHWEEREGEVGCPEYDKAVLWFRTKMVELSYTDGLFNYSRHYLTFNLQVTCWGRSTPQPRTSSENDKLVQKMTKFAYFLQIWFAKKLENFHIRFLFVFSFHNRGKRKRAKVCFPLLQNKRETNI